MVSQRETTSRTVAARERTSRGSSRTSSAKEAREEAAEEAAGYGRMIMFGSGPLKDNRYTHSIGSGPENFNGYLRTFSN